MRVMSHASQCVALAAALFFGSSLPVGASPAAVSTTASDLREGHVVEKSLRLRAAEVVAISARIVEPSTLPANGRVRATWQLVHADDPTQVPRAPEGDSGRKVGAFEIYTPPTPNWSKLLHALDNDVCVYYRAPVAGEYKLMVEPEGGDVKLFDGERWRENGVAPSADPIPSAVPWPAGASVKVAVSVEPLDLDAPADLRMHVELEPNDTPEQAQRIALPESAFAENADEITLQIVGTNDDIEYFDNGRVGRSGDDWFRVEFAGRERKLLTACLSIPDQQVAARIRCYKVDLENSGPEGRVAADQLLALQEYADGKNLNEIAHQQREEHRTAINRWVDPGQVYLLRVEANAPGYELELRIVRPAPYDDPRRAVRQGLYDHIGQVDAWLTNRPRGASVERRIRDVGNLLGTNCMSCHTQSGVWGPAIPFAMGYRAQNVQLWRHLLNTCYQSMRPTNELPDAANNTSLRPLDLGDGPAGTRVAGHAVVSLERFMEPRKLQSFQAIRAANYVVLTGDPGGINAAGPGANVGQGVVFNYAGEIVWTAWKKTGDPKYFRALQDKVRKVLDVEPKYTDDLGHRVEFLKRYVPADWVGAVRGVIQKEAELAAAQVGEEKSEDKPATVDPIAAARELAGRLERTIQQDLQRLRDVQLEGGGWAFEPGTRSQDSQGWVPPKKEPDPSPTSLALIAFEAAGYGPDDPTVAKGIDALLKLQHPTGMWKVQSRTGFVSTAYALHALARFYPVDPAEHVAETYAAAENESIMAAVRRVRDLSLTEDASLVPLMIEAASHPSALVRYWAMVGLGTTHTDAGVEPLIGALGDPTKPVREAAHWALRQTLIDDRGWDRLFDVLKRGDDTSRETAMRALVMKVDGVLPQTAAGWDRLAAAFDYGLNEDPHPGVRAWAAKAAWQWWIWNPKIREGVSRAWIRLLSRPEDVALVEHTVRYQTHAFFIANGHVANGSKTQQYKGLDALFKSIHAVYEKAKTDDPVLARRLTERLVGVAATFYKTAGGDGGPGQMGYVTDGSAELFSDAILTSFDYLESLPDQERPERFLQLTLEGAANIPRKPLQERLIQYSLEGPEKFRGLASSSISDPKLVKLIAVEERLEPMYRQLERGATEPARRSQLSEPILKMFSRVRWLIPETRDQRDSILQYLVPALEEYQSPAEIEKLTDTAAKAKAKHDEDTGWYLASGLGKAIAENTDLHFDAMAEAFPMSWQNPAEAQFWIRSVPWILGFKKELPEVVVVPGALPPIDPYEELRTRAIRLFLRQLTPEAEARNRQEAVGLANQTALRRNPEVLAALDSLVKVEKDEKLIETAQKALSTGRGKFLENLKNAVKAEGSAKYPVDENRNPQLPTEFVEDFVFFRDYVVPEMSRVLRTDRRSCVACHGVPGRTPMDLHHPDDVGFLPADKLLENYRILQDRIDYTKQSRSKLLRKPLNVQTGKEDGHQGGRRYSPSDPGYQILTRWVKNQVVHQALMGRRQPAVRVRRF